MIFDDLDDGEEWFIPPVPAAIDLHFDHLQPPTRHKAAWWSTTDAESYLADLPEFASMMDRGRYMVEAMARSALEACGGTEDDPVLERSDGSRVSLTELLSEMDALELDALTCCS